jgi:hypothetical protein
MMLGLAGNVMHQGLCLGLSDREESVHVVGGASNSDGRTLDSAKNSCDIYPITKAITC